MVKFLAPLLAICPLAARGAEWVGTFALTDTKHDSFPADGGKRRDDLLSKGVTVRSLELSWKKYEPTDDAWDEAYLARIKTELQVMRGKASR